MCAYVCVLEVIHNVLNVKHVTIEVHFNFTSMNTLGIDLAPYLVQEGNVYRLSPTASGPEIKVDTGLAYKNLITQADYANLADPEIHLSYEDHYARMLVPLRLSFNALAIAFLNEGNVEMAGVVMQHAIEKLYHQHLLPSYTNLQAAEILRAIEKDEEADRVSRSAFNYYYSRVKAARDRQQKPDDLEIYVLRRSAELLQTSGDSSYVQQVRALDNR